jgi:hypothetical protein
MIFRRQENNDPSIEIRPRGGAQNTKKARYHRHDEILALALLSAPFVGSYPSLILRYLLYVMGLLVLFLLLLLLYSLRWPSPGKLEAQRAVAFQPEKVPKKLDTIVIGSGSGGSTCANLLAQSGQRVLVLEQHPTVTGGCTHSFREKNCEWDTGL